MLEFAHVVAGGVIAGKIPNPAVSLPLAFLSHFAVDLLPHWNPSLSYEKRKFGKISQKTSALVLLDSLLGLTLGLFLASQKLPDLKQALIVILGCLLGILPDLVEAPFYFLKGKQYQIKSLIKFQSLLQFNISFFPGVLCQIIFVATLIILSSY